MQLTNLARHDKGIVHNEMSETPEGFVKGRAIVTRCGVFPYKNSDGTIRKELRHPDDVLILESLESMKMIPIVDGHPPERLVTSDNAQRLSVGYTGELIEQELPFVIANMVITDKKIIGKIKDKRKNELSLGYTVDLLEEPGIYNGEPYDYRQTNIRYNHLAIVDEARAGPEARITLDGDDAILINEEEFKMSKKAARKVKIDAQEYLLEGDSADRIESMMKEHEELKKAHEDLMSEHMKLRDAHEKMTAERDSLRDKDHHDPEEVHEPLENDEIGANGKEEIDPIDSYGMQSHVKDYEKPSNMENQVVTQPGNEHYPKDLPHITKVDQAEINRRVNERVKLVNMSQRYLDKSTLQRMDSMSDIEIKKSLILTFQKNADLRGKSDVYINARFDSVVEKLPKAKVNANPARMDGNVEKEMADARLSRQDMIKRQNNNWKVK